MKIDLMQLEFIDRLLRTITTETERELEVEFTITSLYRIDDDGVHGTLPVRGLDWRCHSESFGLFVVEYINKRWQYDPSRPHKVVCMFHRTSSGGYHLHIQVCAKTIAR